MIGTGPAAAQFVPRIAPRVKQLLVFQRTPPWVVPHPDRPVSAAERLLYRVLPRAQDVQRNLIFALYEAIGVGFRGRTELIAPIEALGRRHLRRQVADPRVAREADPAVPVRLQAPDPLQQLLPGADAARTSSSSPTAIARVNRALDQDARRGAATRSTRSSRAIGYRYNRSLLVDRLSGVGGRSLGEVWNHSPRAYFGSTVPGFPNMFILLGPNAIGINSVIFTLESQIAYVMEALQDDGPRAAPRRLEVKRAVAAPLRRRDGPAQRRARSGPTAAARRTTPTTTGRNYAIYPGFAAEFRRRTRRFDAGDYEVRAA